MKKEGPYNHNPKPAPARNTGSGEATKLLNAAYLVAAPASPFSASSAASAPSSSPTPRPVPVRSNDAGAAATAVLFHLPTEPQEQAREAVEKGAFSRVLPIASIDASMDNAFNVFDEMGTRYTFFSFQFWLLILHGAPFCTATMYISCAWHV